MPPNGTPIEKRRGEGGGGGVDTPDYFTVSYGELTRSTSVTNRSSYLNLKVSGLVFFCKNKNGLKIYQPSLTVNNIMKRTVKPKPLENQQERV